jgi:hypothetical protein
MRASTKQETSEWLPTTKAARQLGISSCTLKRYFRRDGLLQEGIHLKRGTCSNQSLQWHVRRCREALRNARINPARTAERAPYPPA